MSANKIFRSRVTKLKEFTLKTFGNIRTIPKSKTGF